MAELTLDPKTTALILIDLQHGIIALPVKPYSGPEVAERGSKLAAAFRAAGSTVAYVRVDMADILHLPADQQMRDPNAPPPPAIASQLAPESGYQEGDLLITKRQWGAFYDTGLDQQLRRRGIRTIVICGIATNIGVESTARAAFDMGYALVFVEDAMATISAEAHEFSIKGIFTRMGRVRSLNEVVAALGQ
ncbi:hydrolase [Granulicella sibirica]|uniref:Nicotinamidase/isochorismatase family protein n=1 Tax=Granulicella sibirica TaxID=2479048 RepID=A0A4Q0T8V2_9BACT|nr:hydrolase [Granulicella sibirica]RXH58598.1 Nicotinamidase/isochorismatase family protein [Granulicella sibirica]